jgi:hypothetical protein
MLVMKNDVSKISVVIAELASGTTNITIFGSNVSLIGIVVDGTNRRFHTLNFILKRLHFNSNNYEVFCPPPFRRKKGDKEIGSVRLFVR